MGQDHQHGGKTQPRRVQRGAQTVDTSFCLAHEIRGVAHQAVDKVFEGGGQRHRICQDALPDADADQVLADEFDGGFAMDGFDEPHHRVGAAHPHPCGNDVLDVRVVNGVVQRDDKIGPHAHHDGYYAENQEVPGNDEGAVPQQVVAEKDQSDSGDHHLRVDVRRGERQVEREDEQASDYSRQYDHEEFFHTGLSE